MRSEEEIKKFLERCDAVSGWGMSIDPCPLEEDKPEEPLTEEDKANPEYMEMINSGSHKKGRCAECSFLSALQWVLGDNNNPAANGQNRLIDALKDANEEPPKEDERK